MILGKSVKKGEEIFLNYGQRSNSDFLLHNGFVPNGQNVNNFYELRIGMNCFLLSLIFLGFPKSDESISKQKFLQTKNIRPERGAYTFVLDYNTATKLDLEETALWHFAVTFVAAKPKDFDSIENKKKAVRFLLQRIQLLQRAYGSLSESEDKTAPLVNRFIWRLKKSEHELLKAHEEKLSSLQL